MMVKDSTEYNPLLGIRSSDETPSMAGAGSVDNMAGTGRSVNVASATRVAIPMVIFEKLNAMVKIEEGNNPGMDSVQIQLYIV